MQFHIMNNGIDSLLFGLAHYKKFLKNIDDMGLGIDEYFSELKFSTMAIQNAIELFTKKVLYDVNELLVFTVDFNDNFISNLLHDKYIDDKHDSHMDYFIAGKIEETAYKTIDFKKSIEILRSIFKKELPNSNYETLASLGRMRNAMTHLGYWDDYGWYKILIVINDTLELIKNFYSKIIKNAENYFSKELIEEIDYTLGLANEELQEVWWASWEYQVEEISLFMENGFVDLIDEVNLEMNEKTHSLNSISFKKDEKQIELKVRLIARNDAIVFSKNNVIIWAINMNELK